MDEMERAKVWLEGFIKVAADRGITEPEDIKVLLRAVQRQKLAAAHPQQYAEGVKEAMEKAGISGPGTFFQEFAERARRPSSKAIAGAALTAGVPGGFLAGVPLMYQAARSKWTEAFPEGRWATRLDEGEAKRTGRVRALRERKSQARYDSRLNRMSPQQREMHLHRQEMTQYKLQAAKRRAMRGLQYEQAAADREQYTRFHGPMNVRVEGTSPFGAASRNPYLNPRVLRNRSQKTQPTQQAAAPQRPSGQRDLAGGRATGV